MKKFTLKSISLLIVIAMVMSLSVLCVSAASSPEISANDVTARAGSTAKITISLADNPGLIVLRLMVEYDDEYFSIKSVTDGSKLGLNTHSNTYDKSPYVLYWNNPLRTTNITANGDIAVITFDIDEDTPNGTYDIGLYAADYDVLTTDLKKIGDDFDYYDGSITVTGGSSSSSSSSSSDDDDDDDFYGDEPVIAVSNASVRAGNTFSVNVTLDNNPGIIALRTMLAYNDKYFEITDVKDNGILGDKIHSDVYDDSPYVLYWCNPLVSKNITKNGKLATVTFSCKSNTPAGKYKITPASDDLDIINYKLNALGDDFEFEAGTVTVSKASTTTDEKPKEEDKKEDTTTTPPTTTPTTPTPSVNKTWKISVPSNVLVELTASSVSYGEGRLVSLDPASLTEALKEARASYPGKAIDVKAVYTNSEGGNVIVNLPEGYAALLAGVNSFAFDTPKADMVFDAKAIAEIALVDDSIQFIFGTNEPKDELAKLVKGKYEYYDISSTMTFKDGSVKVTLPYEASSEIIGKYAVVSTYDKAGAKLESVGSGASYTPGAMSFETKKVMPYVITVESVGFKDIEKHWARDYINFVAARGIFNGRSETEFDPDSALSRGMLVTVLGRLEQIDVSGFNCMFADVDKNLYYAPYIEWARQNNIVGGVGDNKFEPDRSVTRQEIAVIVSRYLEFKGKTLKTDALTYTDSAKIDGWAKDFVNKAGNAGIITGVGTEFQPKSNATRAQAATILQRIVAYLD